MVHFNFFCFSFFHGIIRSQQSELIKTILLILHTYSVGQAFDWSTLEIIYACSMMSVAATEAAQSGHWVYPKVYSLTCQPVDALISSFLSSNSLSVSLIGLFQLINFSSGH